MGMFDTICLEDEILDKLKYLGYPSDGTNDFQTKSLDNLLINYILKDDGYLYKKYSATDKEEVWLQLPYHGIIEIHTLAGKPPKYLEYILFFKYGKLDSIAFDGRNVFL